MKRKPSFFHRLIRDHEAWLKAKAIGRLPVFDRLRHHNARKPLLATAAGVMVMLTGSMIANHAHWFEEIVGVPRILVDAFGYFTHGCGAVPVMRYVEPLWVLLFGVE
jgi:hypothetical protein